MLGCATEPNLADYPSHEVAPLPVYAEWWSEMEACSGLHGSMDRIHWFVYGDPAARTFPTQWGRAAGMYLRSERNVLLVAKAVGVRRVVAHEMLHALLPMGGHPSVFDNCGVR